MKSVPTLLAKGTSRLIAAAVLTLSLAAGGVAVALPASADEIGQAPTSSNITGDGSFSTTSSSISSSSFPFGGGRVYYPSAAGTYPVVAASSGFLSFWSSIDWLGPRLASWGFVVVGVETNSVLDLPDSRGDQLRAALDWAVSSSAPSAVQSRADTNRRGVAGWSMGGGGSLKALKDDTSGRIRAGVLLAPYHSDRTWPEVTEPVAIIGGSSDTVASVSSYSIPIYDSVQGPKSFIELSGADHFFPTNSNATVSQMIVSWFKRYLNEDTRFTPFTCGFSGTAISDFRTDAC